MILSMLFVFVFVLGSIEIVSLLSQQRDIDLFSTDASGQSPIDAALTSGYKDVASKIAYLSSVQQRAAMLLDLL